MKHKHIPFKHGHITVGDGYIMTIERMQLFETMAELAINNLNKLTMRKPTLGDVVIYNTTKEEQKKMSFAATCNTQNQLPATVVHVWDNGTTVNLKVDLDGNGQLWIPSVEHGNEERSWNWPDAKVPKKSAWQKEIEKETKGVEMETVPRKKFLGIF